MSDSVVRKITNDQLLRFKPGAVIESGSSVDLLFYSKEFIDNLAMNIQPIFIRKKGIEVIANPLEVGPACPGCGARKIDQRGLRIICAYCGGDR